MKYIRTRDGKIYDKNDLYVCEKINEKPYGTIKGAWLIYQDRVIKEADTIEELCDEFVAVDENSHGHFIGVDTKDQRCWYKFNGEQQKFLIRNCRNTIYGAIWTDKGLIYVAKMNSKGVLELL